MRKHAGATAVTFALALGAAVGIAPSPPAAADHHLSPERAVEWTITAGEGWEGAVGYGQLYFEVCAPLRTSLVPRVIEYTTVDGTATAGLDYVARSGTLVFEPVVDRHSCQYLWIESIDDDLFEGVMGEVPPKESLTLELSLPGGVTMPLTEDSDPVGWIWDDQADYPAYFLVADPYVTEGKTAGAWVMLGNAMPFEVTVQYETRPSSATADDFEHRRGQLTFPPGETVRWVWLPTVDDDVDEDVETYHLVLFDSTPADNSYTGPWTKGWVRLKDNDDPPEAQVEDVSAIADRGADGPGFVEFPVSLSEVSGREVTVDYTTEDGSLVAGEHYEATSGTLTFPAGVSTQTVGVPLRGDAEALNGGNFSLSLSNPVHTSLASPRATATVTAAEVEAPDPPVEQTPEPPSEPTPPPPVAGGGEPGLPSISTPVTTGVVGPDPTDLPASAPALGIGRPNPTTPTVRPESGASRPADAGSDTDPGAGPPEPSRPDEPATIESASPPAVTDGQRILVSSETFDQASRWAGIALVLVMLRAVAVVGRARRGVALLRARRL